MLGFHIDMHVAQFRREYLERWLRDLAGMGYDTILWELENHIKWETCPECAAPNAISKDEFRGILAFSRKLGLEPIPLFQTFGHCEYVLRLDEYSRLAEVPGEISQYCPSNPATLKFLRDWIKEYFELFGELKFFHLGCDETRHLGECPECAGFVAERSKSELFVRHVNALAKVVARHGARPAIWADMLLTHPEALSKLSRRTILFDWMYNIKRNDGKVFVWGKGCFDKSSLPCPERERFKEALFPLGDEPGREPETFYTADFLRSKGFDTVTCPSSSSSGDNVFSPRHCLHAINSFDSIRKGSSPQLMGSVLTSWTHHLFPWELQLSCIEIPHYLAQSQSPSFEDYQAWFAKTRFGLDCLGFWKAAGLLSKRCAFSHTWSLGFASKCDVASGVDSRHFKNWLAEIMRKGEIQGEIDNCQQRLAEYEEALEIFRSLHGRAKKGKALLKLWELSARNLINRAKASLCLLEHESGKKMMTYCPELTLKTLRKLKRETESLYRGIQRPERRKDIIGWIYSGLECELLKIGQD